IRSVDTLARTGGDEFTILLSDPESETDAVAVAERIVEAASKPVRLGEKIVYVGASIGISFCPQDGVDSETLQMKADMAMYESKQGGRGQWRVFSGEMVGRSKDRISLSAQIEAALANDEFMLLYQPIVNSTSGNVERVEALIRWLRPGSSEPMLPDQLIRRAESTGFIRKIDYWAPERACRHA